MKLSRLLAGLLVLTYPALLVGCGMFDFEEREPWRAQAEAACYARGLVKLSAYVQRANAIEGKGICGVDRPLKVSALEDGTVGLGSRALAMSCPLTAALDGWVRRAVIPAAYARYGSPVVEIRNFGSYNCRSRNNIAGARLSEHAFANAFDFAGVKLANGYVVTVKNGWYGSAADRAFLRDIAAGACDAFTTVLGPGSDRQHEDHLHLDLAHHNAQGTYHYCRPRPERQSPTTPLFGPGDAAVASAASPQVWSGAATAGYRPAAARPSGFAEPLPPASVGGASYPASVGTTTLPPLPAQQPLAGTSLPLAASPQPAGCPSGYVCTPLPAGEAVPAAVGAPPVGWSVGAQPAQSYSSTDITGSVPAYSDD